MVSRYMITEPFVRDSLAAIGKLNKSLHDICLIARIFGTATLTETFAQ